MIGYKAGLPGLEYKNTPVALGRGIKDVDTRQGIICGYWSTFNIADDGQVPDVVMPGAFKKTIAQQGPSGSRRIKYLWQHDADKILGTPQVLKEDPTGLYYESQIIRTTFGNDVLLLYEGGAITEHSIGYVPQVVDYDRQKGIRYLKEISLFEGSAVTWGLNPITPVTAIKGVDPEALAAHVGRVQSILHNGRLQDQGMADLLERQINEMQRQLKELRAADDSEPSRPYTIATQRGAFPMSSSSLPPGWPEGATHFERAFLAEGTERGIRMAMEIARQRMNPTPLPSAKQMAQVNARDRLRYPDMREGESRFGYLLRKTREARLVGLRERIALTSDRSQKEALLVRAMTLAAELAADE